MVSVGASTPNHLGFATRRLRRFQFQPTLRHLKGAKIQFYCGSGANPELSGIAQTWLRLPELQQGYCCRKHRSSATSSDLGLRVVEKGPDEKANHAGPYPNGLIWCAISGCGRGFFAFPAPNIDRSCLFGWTLDFLRSYRTLLYGFCLSYH